MKKTLLTIAQVAAIAVIMNSCGSNAEEVKKQVDEQNAAIQTKVDEKLAGLQSQVDMECTTLIDSTATAMYNEWYAAEGKKKGAKPAPKPKTTPKAEEPKKPETVGDGKPKMGTQDANTVGDGKPKMGTSTQDANTVGNGKPKMGTGSKP